MEHVPEGKNFDFAKDLFPLLLEKNIPLQGCILPGYWCDIGTPGPITRAIWTPWTAAGSCPRRKAAPSANAWYTAGAGPGSCGP